MVFASGNFDEKKSVMVIGSVVNEVCSPAYLTRPKMHDARPKKKQKRGHVFDHTHEQDLASNGLLVL